MIVALAGRRVDAPGATPRFPASNAELVASKLRERLSGDRATWLVSSAACGADLLALREAGLLGLRRRIVLPFDARRFRAVSVADRGGSWGELFDAVLRDVAASDVITLPGPVVDDDAAYKQATLAIVDEADRLRHTTNEPLAVYVVWDGAPKAGGDYTAMFRDAAIARGFRVTEISTAGG